MKASTLREIAAMLKEKLRGYMEVVTLAVFCGEKGVIAGAGEKPRELWKCARRRATRYGRRYDAIAAGLCRERKCKALRRRRTLQARKGRPVWKS